MKAQEIIGKFRADFHSEKSSEDAYVARDNMSMIESLNDEAVGVRDIVGQETWIMDDGSYITRLADEYWTGDDVDLFDVEAGL